MSLAIVEHGGFQVKSFATFALLAMTAISSPALGQKKGSIREHKHAMTKRRNTSKTVVATFTPLITIRSRKLATFGLFGDPTEKSPTSAMRI
jgi:hypothetical protein